MSRLPFVSVGVFDQENFHCRHWTTWGWQLQDKAPIMWMSPQDLANGETPSMTAPPPLTMSLQDRSGAQPFLEALPELTKDPTLMSRPHSLFRSRSSRPLLDIRRWQTPCWSRTVGAECWLEPGDARLPFTTKKRERHWKGSGGLAKTPVAMAAPYCPWGTTSRKSWPQTEAELETTSSTLCVERPLPSSWWEMSSGEDATLKVCAIPPTPTHGWPTMAGFCRESDSMAAKSRGGCRGTSPSVFGPSCLCQWAALPLNCSAELGISLERGSRPALGSLHLSTCSTEPSTTLPTLAWRTSYWAGSALAASGWSGWLLPVPSGVWRNLQDESRLKPAVWQSGWSVSRQRLSELVWTMGFGLCLKTPVAPGCGGIGSFAEPYAMPGLPLSSWTSADTKQHTRSQPSCEAPCPGSGSSASDVFVAHYPTSTSKDEYKLSAKDSRYGFGRPASRGGTRRGSAGPSVASWIVLVFLTAGAGWVSRNSAPGGPTSSAMSSGAVWQPQRDRVVERTVSTSGPAPSGMRWKG